MTKKSEDIPEDPVILLAHNHAYRFQRGEIKRLVRKNQTKGILGVKR